MSITIRSSYMRKSLSVNEIRDAAMAALKGVEFDTVIGTGLSGILPLALLAEHFGVSYCAVRKPNDSSHSDGLIEGTIGSKWLFVDDFISSGATFSRVVETVMMAAHNAEHPTECVGSFEYERPDWLMYNDWSRATALHLRVKRTFERVTEDTGYKAAKPTLNTFEALLVNQDGETIRAGTNMSFSDWFRGPSKVELADLIGEVIRDSELKLSQVKTVLKGESNGT